MPDDPLTVIAVSSRALVEEHRVGLRLQGMACGLLVLALLAVAGVAWQVRLMHQDMLTLHRESQSLHRAMVERLAQP